MDNIIEPTSDFDFGQLSLAYPSGIQGGAYFTKLLSRGKPVYIQTPSSLLKQGFTKSGKKWYCDLMFDSSAHELIQWMERLEEKCRELILSKSGDWFQGTLDANDVETSFGAIMRLYRSGKYYLLRANAKADLSGNPLVRFYSEDQAPLGADDVTTDTHVASLLEIQGIKFTTRSFQLEFEVKQMMIVDKEPTFDSCLIKGFSKKTIKSSPNEEISVKSATTVSEALNEMKVNDSTSISATTVLNEMNISEALNEMKVKSEPISVTTVKSEATSVLNETSISSATSAINVKNEPTSVINVKNEPISATTVKSEATVLNEMKVSEATSATTSAMTVLNEMKVSDPTNLENEIITIDAIDLDESDDIKEMTDLSVNDAFDAIQLRKPNQIYFDMYKLAREKAKAAKQSAISAYLEARNIKNTYMLNDSDSDSESDFNELEQL
jgi:hypothetical protein